MPHIVIDYTAGIETNADLPALCEALFRALAADPAIPHPSSLKIRVRPIDVSRIGTEPQSFAHATLRLLPGRDDVTKAKLTTLILAEMAQALPKVGSLSVEAVEMHGASYAKRVL